MAGHLPSSISFAITRALPSLSSSPRLKGSSEDSLKRVGMMEEVNMVIGRKIRKHSYFQWKENRFTGSKMLRALSIVSPITALTLEETH
jgi:hypothetical protein